MLSCHTPHELPQIVDGLKSEIINWLAARYGYQSYLEIATVTTGCQYRRIDRAIFTHTERLMYRVGADFDDGDEIDYRCESVDCSDQFATLIASGKTFDVVFVDPFHTYECSLRDLENGLRLTSPRGLLMVHDCNPPTEDLVFPDFRPGVGWCGLTYWAFIDFVHRRHDLDFSVVDTDYGVGIVGRDRGLRSRVRHWLGRDEARWREEILARSLRNDWKLFAAHRRQLLNLVSLAEFVESHSPPAACVDRVESPPLDLSKAA